MSDERVLRFSRVSERRLDEKKMLSRIQYAVTRGLAGGRGRSWEAGRPRITDELLEDGRTMYMVQVSFSRKSKLILQQEEIDRQFARIEEMASKAIASYGWTFEESKSLKSKGANDTKGKEYTSINIGSNPEKYFKGLYERESQVAIILSSIREYIRSKFENRFHCILHGPPACGKTSIIRSVCDMVGRDAVLHFDATTTTSAGAIRSLMESKNIPPIVCIEEIEKTVDEKSLRWLLGVLDFRCEIRKVTYRESMIREVKLLCIATANDYGMFRSLMGGALESRFSHKVFCPRPSRKVLWQILKREVKKEGGKEKWIKPALDWCINQERTNDPRRVITVCLSGGNDLLSGKYQKHLVNTRTPVEFLESSGSAV